MPFPRLEGDNGTTQGMRVVFENGRSVDDAVDRRIFAAFAPQSICQRIKRHYRFAHCNEKIENKQLKGLGN